MAGVQITCYNFAELMRWGNACGDFDKAEIFIKDVMFLNDKLKEHCLSQGHRRAYQNAYWFPRDVSSVLCTFKCAHKIFEQKNHFALIYVVT